MIRRLGSTALELPAIGQGTGDFFWNSEICDDDKVALLRGGIDLGMTIVDTAEGYGDGASERLVGRALRDCRDRVVVATKFSPEHSGYDDVRRAAEGSLRRLAVDRIDLYQLHWANPAVPLEETMRGLASLVDEGKVRCVGVCNFSSRELADAERWLGGHRIAALQTEYNLFERTIEPSGILDHCAAHGIALLAYSPLDQGRLTAMTRAQREVLQAAAARHGKTVAQVVLRWLTRHPSVVAITRTTRHTHLAENADVMGFDLTGEDIEAIDRAFAVQIVHVPTRRIRVSTGGEWNHAVYQTLEEAIANRHGYVPSPMDLAKAVATGDFLKPVRLVPCRDEHHDYELIGGRIRYWAWVIAHGGAVPIPAYVRDLSDTPDTTGALKG